MQWIYFSGNVILHELYCGLPCCFPSSTVQVDKLVWLQKTSLLMLSSFYCGGLYLGSPFVPGLTSVVFTQFCCPITYFSVIWLNIWLVYNQYDCLTGEVTMSTLAFPFSGTCSTVDAFENISVTLTYCIMYNLHRHDFKGL